MLNTSSALLDDDPPPDPIAHWSMEPLDAPSAEDQYIEYEYGPDNSGTKQTAKIVSHVPDYLGDALELLSTTMYTYDASGRMVAIEIDSDGDEEVDETVEYGYDSRNLRVSETSNGETTEYLFDANNPTGYVQVLEEYVNDQLVKTYTLGHDVISQYDPINGLLTLLYDAHGSTRALVDGYAQVVQRYAYDAYGNMLTGTGLTSAAAAYTTLLYSGEWTDAKLHVQWLGHGTGGDRGRLYDFSNGTFTTANPWGYNSISDPISLNNYLYVHANPMMGIDPSGRSLLGLIVGNTIRQQLIGLAGLTAVNAWLWGSYVINTFWVGDSLRACVRSHNYPGWSRWSIRLIIAM